MKNDIFDVKIDLSGLNDLLGLDYSFKNINKRYLKMALIKELDIKYQIILKNIESANEIYKRLYNMTELFERKSTYDFNFEDWNELKKTKGKLIRYYNTLKIIKRRTEDEFRKACGMDRSYL